MTKEDARHRLIIIHAIQMDSLTRQSSQQEHHIRFCREYKVGYTIDRWRTLAHKQIRMTTLVILISGSLMDETLTRQSVPGDLCIGPTY